jgi:hypothetical protein
MPVGFYGKCSFEFGVNNSILARVGRLMGRSMEAVRNSFGAEPFAERWLQKVAPTLGMCGGGRSGPLALFGTEQRHLDTTFTPRSRHLCGLRLAPRN